jgi:hypothetical protein
MDDGRQGSPGEQRSDRIGAGVGQNEQVAALAAAALTPGHHHASLVSAVTPCACAP